MMDALDTIESWLGVLMLCSLGLLIVLLLGLLFFPREDDE